MKCKVGKICGGCAYLSKSMEEQASIKKAQVEELAQRNHLKLRVGDVLTAKNTTHYRNKVIVGFAKNKGKVYSGLYAAKSHRVVACQNCMMHPDIVNKIIVKIEELVSSMKIELYNEKTRTGLLRHVLIRYAHKTDEVMVVFVTSKKMFPSRRNLVNALVKEFKEIKTIVQNVNPRNTSIVQQDETILLYGDGMITDELCGLKISFSNRSFYQIHSEQCEVLYDMARKMCDLTKTDTVLDTYCGVGTIGLTLASSCKSVTGVEINPEAIENAKLNAKQNNIKNVKFISMDSTRYMMEAKKFRNHYDVIILDPPRAGTTKEFIEASTSLQPKKILYISCDPKTMMRDLVMFRQKGYMTNKIELVDMFPFTEHIETVCLLTREKSVKSYAYVDITPSELGMGGKVKKPTYKQIQAYVLETHGLKVSPLYIANVKDEFGLEKQFSYEEAGMSAKKRPNCPSEKRAAIIDALIHFGMLDEDARETE